MKLRDKSKMSLGEQIKTFNEPIIKNATIGQAPSRLESFESQLSVNPETKTRETG